MPRVIHCPCCGFHMNTSRTYVEIKFSNYSKNSVEKPYYECGRCGCQFALIRRT